MERVISMKIDTDAPDLETWKYFRELLNKLTWEGMSSEEEGTERIGNITVPVFRVKLCTWRTPEIRKYFRFIDKEADNPAIRGTRGTQSHPRIQTEVFGASAAPCGLPRKMYDETWLSDKETSKPAWVVDELRVSKEVFEMLTFAVRV